MTHEMWSPDNPAYPELATLPENRLTDLQKAELANYAQYLTGLADGYARRAVQAVELLGEDQHPHTVDALRRAIGALGESIREVGHSVEAVRS